MINMKKSLAVLLCIAAIITLIPASVYGDDSNAGTGTGNINPAYNAYYIPSQYGWRISLYVAKDYGLSEEEYKSKSLSDDFYYVGYLNMVNNSMNISESTLGGTKNKIDYLERPVVKLETITEYVKYDSCPAIPIACDGNIDTVNAFFLNNNVILYVLDKIAEFGCDCSAFDMISGYEYTYHYTDELGNKKTQVTNGFTLGEDKLMPKDARENVVPWVIIYEPLIYLNLAADAGTVLLTATEFALLQGTVYNWHTLSSEKSNTFVWEGITYTTRQLTPQCVQSLVFKNLPASVKLEESWFGYGTIDKNEGQAWSVSEVKNYGGWGMGFLSKKDPEANATATLEVSSITPNESYTTGTEVISSFMVQNTSETSIYPSDNVTLTFRATDEDGNLLAEETSDPVVLPAGEDTYVWFRWYVTADSGTSVTCTAEFDSTGNTDFNIESAEYSVNVTKAMKTSHTPEPQFEDTAPYKPFFVYAHKTVQRSNSWYDWSFDEATGEFVKNEYTAKLTGTLTEAADRNITYLLPKDSDGTPIMRSGYGVELVMSTAIEGTYTSDAVVMPQSGYFIFPEFSWHTGTGQYETAEKTDYGFTLPENPDAKNHRVHYTPLWFPDGEDIYYSIIHMSDCWTPAGMLESEVASNGLTIDGCLYDGYVITHPKQ